MSEIPAWIRGEVVLRAQNRCEYCQLSQEGQEATFHVDHVIPRNAAGPTTLGNLALACVSCSLRKAARLTAVDPETGNECFLFNPREDDWTEHFRWNGALLVGLTGKGRATLSALDLNRESLRMVRLEQALWGRFPPIE